MKILVLFVSLGLLGCVLPAGAQITPAPRVKPVAVVDPAMVFDDRGQALEIYPQLRATPSLKPGGAGVRHQISKSAEAAPIDAGSLGVVFNHALQVHGYLTGEIAFKPRGDGLPADIDAASWPGLAKITSPHVYVVTAASPREFMALIGRLKARTDLEWVEAVVIYGRADRAALGR